MPVKRLTNKRWPKLGEKLVHHFRKRDPVVADVVEVDRTTGKIALRLGKRVFRSLTAAAEAVTGKTENGWLFWGLRKQTRRRT